MENSHWPLNSPFQRSFQKVSIPKPILPRPFYRATYLYHPNTLCSAKRILLHRIGLCCFPSSLNISTVLRKDTLAVPLTTPPTCQKIQLSQISLGMACWIPCGIATPHHRMLVSRGTFSRSMILAKSLDPALPRTPGLSRPEPQIVC